MNHGNKLMTYFLPRSGRFVAALCVGFSVQRRNQMLLSALLLLSSFALLPDAFAQTMPGPVIDPTVVSVGDRQVTLSWVAPDNTGGLPIIEYGIGKFLSDGTQSGTIESSTTTTHTVMGLDNRTPYIFSIIARNDVGYGVPVTITATPVPTTAPAVITGLTAVAGDTTVMLSWTKPYDGGSPLIDYGFVIIGPGGAMSRPSTPPSGTATTHPVTGLTNGAAYIFSLAARNVVGDGPSADVAATPTSPTAPAGVTDLSAEPGDTIVTLSWTAPDSGGSPITEYGLQVFLIDGRTQVGLPIALKRTTTTHPVPGLTNGTAYVFSLFARNVLGDSPFAKITATPVTVPAAITNLIAEPGDTTVKLSWTAPDDGGSRTLLYTLKVTRPDGTVQARSVLTSNFTTGTVPGLTNGTPYTFSITARNAVGAGPPASRTVSPASPPAVITNRTADSGNTTVTLSWAPPDNGGSPITGYGVQAFFADDRTEAGPLMLLSDTTHTYTFTGLTNGRAYIVSVFARNTVGDSPITRLTATPVTVPERVTGLTTAVGNEQVMLSWTAPANGGSPLIDYNIVITSDGRTARTKSRPASRSSDTTTTDPDTGITITTITYTVTALTNGTPYTFAIFARNGVGPGPSSAGLSATPVTVPDAVIDLQAVSAGGNGTVMLSWIAPANGGSPLIDYDLEITRVSDGSKFTLLTPPPKGRVTMYPVTGLTNGTEYSFSLAAMNGVGGSPAVAVTGSSPIVKPGAVTDLKADPISTRITLSWGPPVNNGGSSLTGYQLVITDPDGTPRQPLTLSSIETGHTVSNLMNDREYSFSLVATNIKGNGPAEMVTATPAENGVPEILGDLQRSVVGDKQITLIWDAPLIRGSPLKQYTVAISATGGAAPYFQPSPPVEINATSHTITGLIGLTDSTGVITELTNDIPYTVFFSVSNDSGPSAIQAITLTPSLDVTAPVIIRLGEATVSLERGDTYSDAGAKATDDRDDDTEITSRIMDDSANVNVNAVGTYTVTYNVSDNALNAATPVTREVRVTADKTPPMITLNGPATVSLEVGGSYSERGATAEDNIDGQITSLIVIGGDTVDANAVGTYSVTYNVSDMAGNAAAEVTRAVIVTVDATRPVITLTGPASIGFEIGGSYTEAGATANDNIDGPINSRIVIDSTSVDTNAAGTYSVTYNVSDIAGNDADEVTRTVIVSSDVTKPVITLNGPATVSLERGDTYTELGATAEDNIDGMIDSSRIGIDSTNVDVNAVDTYSVIYTVMDAALNAAEPVTRTVIVSSDVTKPVITLNGQASISFEVGGSYTEAGATANDNIDGQINSRIVIDSTNVNANAVGTYSVTYNVSDNARNAADEVTRTVNVTADVTKPVITLLGPATVSLERGNTYTELGATAQDNIDGRIDSSRIVIGGDTVDTNTVGTYSVTYTVMDVARNAAEPVTRTVIVTATVPAAPTTLTAVVGDRQITLSWTAPVNNGGSPVSDYKLRIVDSNGTEIAPLAPLNSTATTHTVRTGLSNGTEYEFHVRATNVEGDSPAATVNATPATVPEAPTNLTAVVGDRQITLNWTAPVNNGGSPVSDYKLRIVDTNGTEIAPLAPLNSTATTYTVSTDLSNGTEYEFHLRATNVEGDSPAATVNATPATVPETPTNLTAVVGDRQITLSWTAPVNNGGSPVSDYKLRIVDSNGTEIAPLAPLNSTATTHTVRTGLSNGTEYEFHVRATNVEGDSPAATVNATPATVPEAPTNLTAVVGDRQITLNWTAPVNNGGSPVSDYKLRIVDSNGTEIAPLTALNSTATTHTVRTGLSNGTEYEFYLRATNVEGDSPVATVNATPATVPEAPTNLTAVVGDRQITLNWTAPVNNGGSPVSDYKLRIVDSNGTEIAPLTALNSTATTHTVRTGLSNGTEYEFYLRATNVEGDSPAATVNATPATEPETPTNLTAVVGDRQITLNWTAPVNNGGSPVSDYKLRIVDSNGTEIAPLTALNSTATTHTVRTGLSNGTAYEFHLRATNVEGDSPAATVNATPATVPPPVTNLTAVVGDRQITLNWTAPVNNGGSPVSDYKLQIVDTNGTEIAPLAPLNSTATTYTVSTGLSNGTAYEFHVRATNVEGDSPAATVNATPATVPETPTNLTAVVGDRQITLSWTAPVNNGGSPVSDYKLRIVDTNGTEIAPLAPLNSTATTYTVSTDLSNGTEYEFHVRATNVEGDSPAATVNATPATVPPPVTNLTAVVGDRQITLNWTAPVNNGGSPVSDYKLQIVDTTNRTGFEPLTPLNSTATTHTVSTGLSNGTEYEFYLRATNVEGDSPAATVNATPATEPETPTNLTAVVGNGTVTLSWTAPVNNGGLPVSDYKLRIVDTNGTEIAPLTALNSTATTYTVSTGLSNGTEYEFHVRATNVEGDSPAATVNATPATVPEAPTNLTAVVGDRQITLSWTAPVNNGGSPVSDYKLRIVDTNGTEIAPLAPLNSTATTYTVSTGLSNGTEYEFHVRATNVEGDSPAATVNATPATVPPPVTNLTVVSIGDGEVELSWTAPVNNGGSPVSDYKLRIVDTNGTEIAPLAPLNSTATTYTVSTGLSNGTEYEFHVRATNVEGDSPAATVNATPATVPEAPTNLTAVVGNGTVTLNWTAPVNNGGSPVSDYKLRIVDTNGTEIAPLTALNSTVTTHTVSTGLSNGTEYEFHIRATNVEGDSPAATVNATPATVPETPTNLTAVVGDRQITLSWTAPVNNGGSPVSDYKLRIVDTNGTEIAPLAPLNSTATTYTVSTGLSNGTEYEFHVRATNVEGDSPAATVNATPATEPETPTNLTAVVGNGTVTLSWTAPVNNGGLPVSDYKLRIVDTNGTEIAPLTALNSTATTYTVSTGLTNGTAYEFYVRATNGEGDSPAATVNATPVDKTKPVIILNGFAAVTLERGDTYTDAKATATDNTGKDITSAITTTPPNPVDTTTLDTYTITYNVTDSVGNKADPVTRAVTVISAIPSANAGADQSVAPGANVILSGSGTDVKDDAAGTPLNYAWTLSSGTLTSPLSNAATATARFTAAPTVTSTVTYVFTLTVTDSDGNPASDTVTVSVTSDRDIGKQNKVILASVARAIADQNVNAISRQISEAGEANLKNSLGGNTNVADILKSMARLNTDSSLNAKEALGNSRFAVALDGIGGALWGKIDYQKFKGTDQSVKYNAALFSSTLGVEGQINDQTRLGLALSHNKSDIDYTDSAPILSASRAGDYEVVMLSVNPYIAWKPSDDVDLWATLGYGQGDLELILADNGGFGSSDLSQKTVAAGGSGLLLDRGAIELRLKGEALKTQFEVDKSKGIAALELDATRLRVGLEGSHALSLEDGATLNSSVEVGVRYDGGDGQTGSKGEIGGGLEYSNGRGLTLQGNARVLVGGGNYVGGGTYDEWGLGGLLKFQPSTDGRGVSFNLGLGQGSTVSKTEDIWKNALTNKSNAAANVSTTSIKLGYGITAPHWLGGSAYGILTPYTEVKLGNSNSYGLGLDWRINPSIGFKLNFKNQSDSVNSVNLEGEIGF